MKNIFAVLCCLLVNWSAIGQKSRWENYVVDKHLTVAFPTAPQEMDVPRTMAALNAAKKNDPMVLASRAFRAEDATATYAVVCIPLAGKPELPLDLRARELYYKTHTIPLLIAHARGELLEQQVQVSSNQPDALSIKYRVLNETGSPIVKYLRLLVVGQMMYQFHLVPKDKTGVTGILQRKTFFDSVIVTR